MAFNIDNYRRTFVDAKKGVSGNQAFKWIGAQDFHDRKGELRYEDKGSKVIVQGDVNVAGKADFEIFVKVGALSSGDFLAGQIHVVCRWERGRPSQRA